MGTSGSQSATVTMPLPIPKPTPATQTAHIRRAKKIHLNPIKNASSALSSSMCGILHHQNFVALLVLSFSVGFCSALSSIIPFSLPFPNHSCYLPSSSIPFLDGAWRYSVRHFNELTYIFIIFEIKINSTFSILIFYCINWATELILAENLIYSVSVSVRMCNSNTAMHTHTLSYSKIEVSILYQERKNEAQIFQHCHRILYKSWQNKWAVVGWCCYWYTYDVAARVMDENWSIFNIIKLLLDFRARARSHTHIT